jgi:hypothetical protein
MTFSNILKQIDTSKYIEKTINIKEIKAQHNPERFKYWLQLHHGPFPEVLNMLYSPHYRFLKEYEINKRLVWDRTPYYELQRLYGRKKDWIYEKILKFIKIYEAIKNYEKLEPIQVLSKPVVSSVFNDSYEIFEGHHRVAGYLIVGKSEILCREISI